MFITTSIHSYSHHSKDLFIGMSIYIGYPYIHLYTLLIIQIFFYLCICSSVLSFFLSFRINQSIPFLFIYCFTSCPFTISLFRTHVHIPSLACLLFICFSVFLSLSLSTFLFYYHSLQTINFQSDISL